MPSSQEIALAIVPKFSAFLSILGSGWIIYENVRDRKKLTLTYHRLMLAMSIGDISVSFAGFFLTTWPIPRWETGVFQNVGTQLTCDLQGFFGQIGAIYTAYNAYLAIYFVLLVRFNWKEKELRRVEWIAHIVTLLMAFGTATAAIILKLFNNYVNLTCWMSESPMGCTGDDCVRGQNAIIYQYAFYFSWVWAVLITITVMMLLLYWTVHQQAKKMSRYADGDAPLLKSKRRVATQAFLYIAAYYTVAFFPTLQLIIKSITGGGYFIIYLGNGIFFPLQGLFNCIIYLRPRYLRYKRKHPGASTYSLVKQTMQNPSLGRRIKRSAASFMNMFRSSRQGLNSSSKRGEVINNRISSDGRNHNCNSTNGNPSSNGGANSNNANNEDGNDTTGSLMSDDDYKLGTLYEIDLDPEPTPIENFADEEHNSSSVPAFKESFSEPGTGDHDGSVRPVLEKNVSSRRCAVSVRTSIEECKVGPIEVVDDSARTANTVTFAIAADETAAADLQT